MNERPIEKMIQEAGLKGKALHRGVWGDPTPESPFPPSPLPFPSSTQLQVADLLVLINSPNAGKTSKFQLSASLGFHGKGREGADARNSNEQGVGQQERPPSLPGPTWEPPLASDPNLT